MEYKDGLFVVSPETLAGLVKDAARQAQSAKAVLLGRKRPRPAVPGARGFSLRAVAALREEQIPLGTTCCKKHQCSMHYTDQMVRVVRNSPPGDNRNSYRRAFVGARLEPGQDGARGGYRLDRPDLLDGPSPCVLRPSLSQTQPVCKKMFRFATGASDNLIHGRASHRALIEPKLLRSKNDPKRVDVVRFVVELGNFHTYNPDSDRIMLPFADKYTHLSNPFAPIQLLTSRALHLTPQDDRLRPLHRVGCRTAA
jgi:hypothetical protein